MNKVRDKCCCEQNNIEQGVIVKQGAVVHPFACVSGDTIIGKNTVIGAFCSVVDSIIGDNCTVQSSTLTNCRIGNNCTVGPYAHIKAGSIIGNNCRIGNFVEIKNSQIDDNVKVAHLAYIGDATVGSNVNVGCGVVFANYDGVNKHKTVVGKNSFIGCNVNIVAPRTIGEGCFIAAGSTVDCDLNDNSFYIQRSARAIKPNKRSLLIWQKQSSTN